MSDNDAIDLAHRMRWLMSQDVEEFELARRIEVENQRLTDHYPGLIEQAWNHLEAHERRAWKDFLTYRRDYERQP